MAEFSRGVKRYWMNVAKHVFGTVEGKTPEVRLIYDEAKGWRLSGKVADEVHHAIPGCLAEENGQLANEQVGIPVGRKTHRGRSTLPYDVNESFHPDMEEARIKYRLGDKKAYEKCRLRHVAEVRAGKYPPCYVPEEALVLEEIMREAAVRYTAETGNKKPQSSRPRPRRKHWSDGLF